MSSQFSESFALKRDWQDAEPGIEVVELHFVCAPSGEPPDWGGEECAVLVPHGAGPLHARSGAIDLPCGLGGAPAYTLHYYFLVIQHGRQRTLPPASEEIVSRQIAYHDRYGRYRAVGVQWSVGSTNVPNYTLLAAEQFTPGVAINSGAANPQQRAPSLAPAVALPAGLPCSFKGYVWGPRGATVYHVFHLQPRAAPDAPAARELWDTNGGRIWKELL